MKKILYSFLVFLFVHTSINAQIDKTYYLEFFNDEVFMSSVNLETDERDTIGILEGITSFYTSTSSFNAQTNKLIIISNLGVTLLDVSDASVANAFPVTILNNLVEYYNGRTYSLVESGGEWEFYSMDLTNGIETIYGQLEDVFSFQWGTSTFDYDQGHFIFNSNLGITIVDVEDGSIFNTIEVPIEFNLLEYYNSKCYGVSWIEEELHLLSVDLNSGITDTIGLIENINNYTTAASTMNREMGTFMFIGNQSIILVDVNDASIIATYPVTQLLSILEYQEDIKTSEKNTTAFIDKVLISPNPSVGYWLIDLGRSYSQLTLSVHSVDGRLVARESHEYVDQVSLDLDAADGVYFLTVQTEIGEEVFLLNLIR